MSNLLENRLDVLAQKWKQSVDASRVEVNVLRNVVDVPLEEHQRDLRALGLLLEVVSLELVLVLESDVVTFKNSLSGSCF